MGAFNRDELAAQALAGGGPRSAGGIRDFMTDQHRLFFAQLPYIFVAPVDADGWPVATVLTGPPGFVHALNPTTLQVSGLPPLEDSAHEALAAQRDIAILGIDLSTRRRNRANGRVVRLGADGFDVAVAQSFGNCPQYIERRNLASGGAAAYLPVRPEVEVFDGLDAMARTAIAAADTFFVASRSRPGRGAEFGADISHRGGPPGFVRVEGNVLSIPDFPGNRFFNTLGNLMADPRASLLFVQFDSGDVLQLQGYGHVDFRETAPKDSGAERVWRFEVVRGSRRRQALGLRWTLAPKSGPAAASRSASSPLIEIPAGVA